VESLTEKQRIDRIARNLFQLPILATFKDLLRLTADQLVDHLPVVAGRYP